MDLHVATQIAREYVARLGDNGLQLVLFPEDTVEREFGWIFFYGPHDSSVSVAGNAPFIIDRTDGAIHLTGTAFPLEHYLDSYRRVGRTYPFATPEHVVILEGWNPGMLKNSLTKLIHWTDEVLANKRVTLTFRTADDADAFCSDAQDLGAVAKRETHFH